jgi:RNA polymerase sigma-70 factor (ECF subfamily)
MGSHSLLTGVLDEATLERLFLRANAVKWGLAREVFAEAVGRSVASRFGASGANVGEIEAYVETLHLEDLALACACSAGQVTAWAYFLECFRPALRTAARAIAGDEAGVELADDLYGELYGLEQRDGRRRSLFDYFHGRSRLATWLRAVLAQRHIDRLRQGRRLEPLEEEESARKAGPSERQGDPDPDRSRYARLAHSALARAISHLAPRDRLRLASYYLHHLTLAQIGRLLAEHEATVSRKLERLRRDLREQVVRTLRDEHKLTDQQVEACFEFALDKTPVSLERALREPGLEQERAG